MADVDSDDVVAIEYAGKWLAWDFEETRILASAESYEDAKAAALSTGESRPVLVRAPDADKRFIGLHS
ncbi:hypothetical protein [Aeoliella sp. SH292]|uniref:hypothetical protein n=1 Tax=Aeoliella sp. SH292 TaxID=3454464 RepID=UPI003F999660